MGYIVNLESIARAKGLLEEETAPEALQEAEMATELIPKQESKPKDRKKLEVPIWFKANLTLEEAAAYSGIGVNKLREITDEKDCYFVLFIGRKRLIKRRQFEKYLEERCVI